MLRQALQRVTARTTRSETAGDTDDISWRVGIFALERLRPDPQSWLTPNVLWADYSLWCRRREVTPLSVEDFLEKFDDAAATLGVRKMRAGKTVGYAQVSLRPQFNA